MKGVEKPRRRRWDCQDGGEEDHTQYGVDTGGGEQDRGFSIRKEYIEKPPPAQDKWMSMGNYSAGTVNYPMGTVNYPAETGNFRTEKMNYTARTPNRQEEAIFGTRVPDSTLPSTSAKINKRKFQEEPPHQIWAKKYDIPLPQEILDQCLEKECNICEIQTTSITTCQQHYQGTKHAKKVAQRIEEIFKNKPDEPKPKRLKSDLSPSITSQAESFLADLAGSMDIPLTPQQDTVPIKEGPFHCTHCNINCQSKTPYEMHLQGKAHLKKVKQQEEGVSKELFRCELCHISCNSEAMYQTHVNGKKHQASVKKKEDNAEPGGFSCDVCKVSCSNEENFEKHMKGKPHAKMVRKLASVETLCQ